LRFRLVPYFVLTSLAAFLVVTAALAYFYRKTAIDDLLVVQESKNIALTRLFGNSIWDSFRQFVAKSPGRTAEELKNDPEMPGLREAVRNLVKGLTVVKIKVYNLDGMTVYSSEEKQIGEDKKNNAGFRSAHAGIPVSELTHRDSFSAFEGVVEDRDVISSYIPIHDPRSSVREGVFEVYDDVTPFLKQIGRTQWVVASGVIAALSLLFLALFIIVRRADRIILEQERERMETEAHLLQREKMASLGQMVTGIAQELDAPLGITRNGVSHVAGIIPDGEPRKILNQCLTSIDKISGLAAHLKDFAAVERGKMASVNLNAHIDHALRSAKNVLKNRIEVVKLYGTIPPVQCRPSQIGQALFNLIVNAAEAIAGTGKIWIRTEQRDGGVEIVVQDDGRGIPPSDVGRIFDPFFTTKASRSGAGLGLSIVDKIVREHSGTIEVLSKPNAGTRFTILLPVSQERTLAQAQAA
jgi:signal transduction histidine kinase